MLKRRFAIALAVLLLLAACGPSTPPIAAGRERVNIGTIGGVSGPQATQTAGILKGIKFAVDEYNGNPDSTYAARLVMKDTGGAPEAAAQRAQELSDDPLLVGVIGPFADGEARAASAVFKDTGIPFLVPSVSSVSVPVEGSRSFRRLIANSAREGVVLAEQGMAQAQGAAAIFHDGGSEAPAFLGAAQHVLAQANRPVQRLESVVGRTDIKGVVASLVQAPPGFVLYWGGGRGTDFLKALREAGYKGPILVSHHLRAGQPPTEPLIALSPQADFDDAPMRVFSKRFQSKYSSSPLEFSIEAYEGTVMLLEAIQEVQPKAPDVGQFLRANTSFRGDSKRYAFDESGELPGAPLWVYESRGGAWRLTARSG